MKPRIRLLAIDIDGTLLDSSFCLPLANLEALQRAHRQDVEVTLVTGRRHTFALPIAEQLGFDLWLISSNGAVTRSLRGEPFHRDLLPLTTARDLCTHMDTFRGQMVLTFDIETRGALVLEGLEALNHSISHWLEKNAPYIELTAPIEKALLRDPIQAMFCGTIEAMRKAEERLSCTQLQDRITVLKTAYPARDLCILDVLNQGCSKGHALKRWAEHKNIAPTEIMAIGDNYNDVEMLEFAGFPFIMENASEELKRNGWPVTLSNDQSGVAAAIERYIS